MNTIRFKKSLAVLLALVLVMGLLPMTALADTPSISATGLSVTTDGTTAANPVKASTAYHVMVSLSNNMTYSISPSVTLYQVGNSTPVDTKMPTPAALGAGASTTVDLSWTPSAAGTVSLQAVVTDSDTLATLDTYTSGTIAVTVADGSYSYNSQTAGVSGGTYTINTPYQLVQLATAVNAGTNYTGTTFQLTADIDLSSVCGASVGNWTQIGTYTNNRIFSGTFDGNNKTISNLYISTSGTIRHQGLFGWVSGATIKNLTVTGVITVNSNDINKAGHSGICRR